MKQYIIALVLCALVMPGFAADRSRVGNVTSPRLVVAPASSKSFLQSNNVGSKTVTATGVSVVDDNPQPAVDRDKEKTACISNNIGVGNTFVWASRDSDISDYASMVEDVQNPDNNVCWVRLELKSNASNLNISDFNGQYFEMGKQITCGSWIDEEKLEKRILDAKKTVRTLATIGGALGGIGVGVGAMEWFGNDLVDAEDGTERLISDSVAGVVLGTAGGVITGVVVKKNQLKKGFEDVVCTVGGQEVGSYGDEITVGVK